MASASYDISFAEATRAGREFDGTREIATLTAKVTKLIDECLTLDEEEFEAAKPSMIDGVKALVKSIYTAIDYPQGSDEKDAAEDLAEQVKEFFPELF